MLNFYEFSNLLEGLRDKLIAKGFDLADTPTKPAAIAPGKSPLPITLPSEPGKTTFLNKPRIDPTEPRQEPEPIQSTPAAKGAEGSFRNAPTSFNVGDVVDQDKPVIGINNSKSMVDPGAHIGRGIEIPTLREDPVILDYRQKHPDLDDAFKAINGPYSKKRPFTVKELGSVSPDKLMAALQIMKDDRQIDFKDKAGRPMKLNRADLGDIQIVRTDITPASSADKTDLQTASPEAQAAADRETQISPRYRSNKDKIGPPKPGTPTLPQTKPTELGDTEKILATMNTAISLLTDKFNKHEPIKPELEAKIQNLLHKTATNPNVPNDVRTALAVAFKKVLKNEVTQWMDYFDLMESYHPSIMK